MMVGVRVARVGIGGGATVAGFWMAMGVGKLDPRKHAFKKVSMMVDRTMNRSILEVFVGL